MQWLAKVTPIAVLKWASVIFVVVLEVLVVVALILSIVRAY